MIPAVMPTYDRKDVAFDRGEGSYLYALDGRRFLDFTSGIAVNNLGHCHPHLVKTLQEQAARLWHTSNLYRIAHGERLAQRLVENSFADTMFFSNSGAEAIEGGIKLVRKYQYVNGKPQRYKVICFDQAFHGRTGAALAATGNAKYLEGFGPKAPGFVHVPLNNSNVVRDAIDDETAAILIEPIQGEGGVRSGAGEFLRALRQICDEFGLLLFFDEIQCGFGRTGRLWAHEWFDVKPDVMAVAKGIGNGFPLGAFLATEKAAAGMVFGTHGSTYGGNPLATATANAVLDIMLAPGFFEGVRERADWFRPRLEALVAKYPKVLAEVRGSGFITGLRCHVPSGDMVNALFERQMLTVGAGDNVVRIYPSLIAPRADLEHGLSIIDDACQALTAKLAAAQPAGAAHG
ncbi:MAG: aspartate aminotransferase family protein [Alphaproteobacteria bacterium]|nr:aspartate aminotransferase family protein [Alphaproteobacteria bacterium]